MSRIRGVGTDLVDIDRFRTVLTRTPGIRARLFCPAEIDYAEKRRDPTERYAARFAAKEATMKALGAGIGQVLFRDIEVVRADSGAPTLELRASAAARAAELGIEHWNLSMTHSESMAHAIVIAS